MANVGGKAEQKDTENTLVQPQGVNAGDPDPVAPPEESAQETEPGGDVDGAPDRKQGLIGYPDAKSDQQLTGGPVDPGAPPQEKDGSSGQDDGLMS